MMLETRLKMKEIGFSREFAMQNQPSHLFEGSVFSQGFDRIAAVEKAFLGGSAETDGRVASDNAS